MGSKGALGLKFSCAGLIVKKKEGPDALPSFLFNFKEAQEPLDKSGLRPRFRKGGLDGERALDGGPV